MYRWRSMMIPLLAAVCLVLGSQLWLGGQQPKDKAAADPSRFEFEVIQSFDAKYQGDTPGHIGKYGGLESRRPQVALGDPVFRGEEKIGVVTSLIWNRGQGSLEVEFHPVGKSRICVGDAVWLALNNRTPAAPSDGKSPK